MDLQSLVVGALATLGIILLGWLVERQLGIHVAPRLNARLDARRERRATKRLRQDAYFKRHSEALSHNAVASGAHLQRAAYRSLLSLIQCLGCALLSVPVLGAALYLTQIRPPGMPNKLLTLGLLLFALLGFLASLGALYVHHFSSKDFDTYSTLLLRLTDETRANTDRALGASKGDEMPE